METAAISPFAAIDLLVPISPRRLMTALEYTEHSLGRYSVRPRGKAVRLY